MTVDFDGLREQIAKAYSKVVDGYNACKDDGNFGSEQLIGEDLLIEGLAELRPLIQTLLCVYVENSKESSDLYYIAYQMPELGSR